MSALSPTSHIYFSERLRLHYVQWGDPSKPALVLVHGIHDHCRTWDQLVPALVDRYRVVAPDLRGHGDSEWLRGSSYHYLDYLYDLHQLIDQAALAPVALVGHSMGGAIVAQFAGVYPELVQRLVVIEGIGLWGAAQPVVPVHERIAAWIANTRQLATRTPRRYESLHAAYQRMQEANPQLSDAQALHLTTHGSNQNEDGTYSWKYDPYTYNFSGAGIASDDVVALWRRIACPVQIINAQHGLEHRIGHGATAEHFQRCQVHEIAAAGHWTHHDQRDAILELMLPFLRS